MLVFPHAKINLGLYITGKRTDGYHNIETIMWPVPWNDLLEAVPSPDGVFSFRQTGQAPEVAEGDNLVVKAWRLMQGLFNLPPAHIHLHKRIPMGAGLGGGSSDAAHTIVLLNRLFDLGLKTRRMASIATKLGSDCPFFIDGKAHFAAGRGELLSQTHVDLSGLFLGIVKPPVHISTAEAYHNVVPSPAPSRWELPGSDPDHWRNTIGNQFEMHLFPKYPEIATIKEDLYHLNAVYASLTGSGSAVYGLFREKPHMSKWFPGYQTWQGQL